MKSLFVVDPMYRLTKYRSVAKACSVTGISVPTVKNYMNKGISFKGYRFYSRKPSVYKPQYLPDVTLSLESMSEDREDVFIAMIELMSVSTESDLDMVIDLFNTVKSIDRIYAINRYLASNYEHFNAESREYVKSKINGTQHVPKFTGSRSASGCTFTAETSFWK